MTAIKEWTLPEAQAAQRAFELANAADPLASSRTDGPFWQWVALRDLDFMRQRYEDGDHSVVLQAVHRCAQRSIPLPDWVAQAFVAGYNRVVNCRAKSWDDVFGRPYPKGANLNALRKRRTIRFAVWNEVQRILMSEPDTAIDAGLFERVGKSVRLPVGKTEADKLYYQAAKVLGLAQRPRG